MKIRYAYRITKCKLCGEDIPKGTQRLDDSVKRNGHLLRLHYHPGCFTDYIRDWAETHPNTKPVGRGGRLPLDLAPEQRKRREQLVSNLNALKRYYFPKDGEPKIDLQGDIFTIDTVMLRRAQHYSLRYDRIVEELEGLGGLPRSHGGQPHPNTKEEIPMT